MITPLDTGKITMTCFECGGEGSAEVYVCDGDIEVATCETCKGEGTVIITSYDDFETLAKRFTELHGVD